jgi:hypothetical protein
MTIVTAEKIDAMKERFSEEQIISVLKEAEARLTLAELCHKQGISEEKPRTSTGRRCLAA